MQNELLKKQVNLWSFDQSHQGGPRWPQWWPQWNGNSKWENVKMATVQNEKIPTIFTLTASTKPPGQPKWKFKIWKWNVKFVSNLHYFALSQHFHPSTTFWMGRVYICPAHLTPSMLAPICLVESTVSSWWKWYCLSHVVNILKAPTKSCDFVTLMVRLNDQLVDQNAKNHFEYNRNYGIFIKYLTFEIYVSCKRQTESPNSKQIKSLHVYNSL